jgi:hypothetical protein
MMDTVRSHLRSTQKQSHIVHSYFHNETVRYAAPRPLSNGYRSR